MTPDVPPEQIGQYLKRPSASAQEKNGTPPTLYLPTLWIDVTAPTEDDWRILKEQFDFHPLAIEDAQNERQRAKVDAYDGYLFLSVRTWAGIPQKVTSDVLDLTHEIDIFLGPNYLVTVHQEPVSVVNDTRKRWERNSAQIGIKPAYLLYLLLDAVVDDYFPVMDDLDTAIDDLESELYSDVPADPHTGERRLPDMKPALVLKKRLLLLRQAVAPHRDILNYLLRTDDQSLMPRKLHVFYQDVYDHTLRLTEQIDLHRDIMGGVMDSMMTQASNRMAETSNRLNQVMKTMTVISTILMSASLISGVYGMNFDFMPELHWKYGYAWALGLMATVATGLALYFKRIRWF
ncbi:MAG: magnesium/cobalt transporter CorA [Akkermansiaceae bacterium]|nr:magnesium/cobalt transporter CorA [Armatimonadota bacterium]